MKKFLGKKVNDYEETFIGTGEFGRIDHLFAGVVEGRKKDTLFHILMVFRNDTLLYSKEWAKATFYKSNGSIIEEYILGRIYIGYNKNKQCLEVYFDSFVPHKVDTMKNKCPYWILKTRRHKVLEFCPHH